MSEHRIHVVRLTPGTGHVEAALTLDAVADFVDEEVRQGRCVVAESGDQSFLGRVGRAVVEWFRGLRDAGGKPPGREKLTSLPPMAGGSGPPPVAMQHRFNQSGAPPFPVRPVPIHGGPIQPVPEAATAPPEAWQRSWDALVERVGKNRATGLLHGGGYAVRSTFWPEVLYIVTVERIRVVGWGVQLGTLCLQTTDGSPPWDRLLAILAMLDTGTDGEAELWAKANSL